MRFADSDVGLIRFVGPCRRFIKEIVAFGVLKHSHDHLHCPVDRIVGKPVQHFGNTRRATRRYWQDLPHGVATLVRSAKYGRVSGRRQITSLRGFTKRAAQKKSQEHVVPGFVFMVWRVAYASLLSDEPSAAPTATGSASGSESASSTYELSNFSCF